MTSDGGTRLSGRHIAVLLGVITLLIIPTGAALVNSGTIDFLGEESGLELTAADGPNGQYVKFDSEDQLSVNISSEGVNLGAVTTFDHVFVINNTAEEVREVWINHTNDQIISLYDSDTDHPIGFDDRVSLAPGERISVGLSVDLRDEDVNIGASIQAVLTIHSRDLTPDDAPEVGLPRNIDFGNVTNGTVETRSVTISNDGGAPMALDGVSISGTDADSFSLAGAGNLPDVLGSGESVTISVEGLPSRTGEHSASLVVATNDTETPTATVPITLNSVPADLTVVSGDRVAFGEVETDTAVQRTVTLRNDGSTTIEITDLRLSGADAGSFSAVEAGVLGDLAPGATVDVTVVFAPTRTGDHSATLEVRAAGGNPVAATVSLSGTGIIPADISVDPTAVDFGSVGKNEQANAAVTITNDGEQTLTISGLSIRGTNANQFAIRSGIDDRTLEAGESRTVTVGFNPTLNGDLSASLRIESSDADTPVRSVPLRGTSVPATLTVKPTELDFGNVTPGSTKTLEIEVGNDADSLGDLRITSTAILGRNPGTFQITGGAAPYTLAPGETETIVVTYSPETTGIKTAQLRVLSNGDPEQIDVWMSNTGWRVRIQEVKPGERGIDAEEEDTNLDTTRIKQTATNVEVDINDLTEDADVQLNVSSPGTRTRKAGIEEVSFRTTRPGTFDMNFVHDDGPPLDDSNTYDPASGEAITQYVTLFHSIENEAFADPTLDFQVKRANLEPGTEPDEVVFRRFQDGQWRSYDLTLLRTTASHYVYRVSLPGFSEFVITSPTSQDGGGAGGGGGGAGAGGGGGGGAVVTPPGEEPTPTEPTDDVVPPGTGVEVDFGDTTDATGFSVTELDTVPGEDSDAPPLAAIDRRDPDTDAEIQADVSDEIRERLDAAGADALVLVGDSIQLTGSGSVIPSTSGIDGRGQVVRGVDITVPEALRDQPATVRLTVDRARFGSSAPAGAQIGHYTGTGWQILPTRVVSTTAETVTVEARTPGFSPFAVFADNRVRYTWELPDGSTVEGRNIEPTFAEPGIHNVNLTVTDAFGRSDTDTVAVLANDEPSVAIIAPDTIEPGENVTLEAEVDNEVGNVTITWEFSDGTEATGPNVTRSFETGSRDVRVVVTDEFGASGEASQTLPVGPAFGAQQLRSMAANMPFEAQVLLSFLLAIGVTFIGTRLFGSSGGWLAGITLPPLPFRRSHPPEIMALGETRLNQEGGRFVVRNFTVSDPEGDLESITLEVRNGRGSLVARRMIELEQADRYEAQDESVPALSRVYLTDDEAFEITLRVLDARGEEASATRPVRGED